MNTDTLLSRMILKHAYKAFTNNYPVLFYTLIFQKEDGVVPQEVIIEFKYDEVEQKLIRPLSYGHGQPQGVNCPLCGRWTGNERDYTRCKAIGDIKYILLDYINQQTDLELVPSQIKTLTEIQSE
ncbi:hypothetical protein [Paenibacillus glycanilyticus]|uniref:Uncharacterized protein n=1 Tax=Paenibacillus glycanilyticus TaxID=126569 RepID=A0ABQ6GAI0_9BACL|nr:hypothetical protein [Paenibacillus glycanilyticus]GLX66591.1 hypothetical protein MU1_09350 [Paenibacillus glycanilyticus]